MTRNDSARSLQPSVTPARAVGTRWRGAVLFAAIVISSVLPASAQPGLGSPHGLRGKMGRPPFLRELFRPETVMKHQRDIKLTDEQRAAITEAIKTTQGKVLELQWKLEEEQQKLTDLLEAERIDVEAALTQADLVMDTERKVKKEHLALLIQIKNVLTPDQQRQLREKSRPGKRKD